MRKKATPKRVEPAQQTSERLESLRETESPRNYGADSGFPRDMPGNWISQIKEAFKQENKNTFWITLVGSSVIAALITVIANFGIESYKGRLNRDLEEYKAELQRQNTAINEVRNAYSNLAVSVETFEQDLKNYASTCQIAAQNPRETQFAKWARQSWDLLTDQIADVRNAESKVDPEIGKEIDQIISKILINQAKVQQAPHKNPELVSKQNELLQAIKGIKNEIERKKNSLVNP